ncbi:hypothetical protein [Marinicellulosiphila megalodicopiae]|uniref:hypothetical protein n=1 Tax=Marinicellulosiphila megalodicopiae TaxID=2724896 RepID=UPI003BAE7178
MNPEPLIYALFFLCFCVFYFVTSQLWACTYGRKKLGLLKAQLGALVIGPLSIVFCISLWVMSLPKVEYIFIVEDRSELLGTWTYKDLELKLKSENKFELSYKGNIYQGKWTLIDWSLDLDYIGNKANMTYLRLYKYEDTYRWLIVKRRQDPDTWNLEKSFIKTNNDD